MSLFRAGRRSGRSVSGRQRAGLASLAAAALLVAGVSSFTSPASAAVSSASRQAAAPCATPLLRAAASIHGVVPAVRVGNPARTAPGARAAGAACGGSFGADPHARGAAPPLIWHKGNVMSTPTTHDSVTVTPIFWAPTGYSFTSSYENLIMQFLSDAAAASDTSGNVFSTVFEYRGSNGWINYNMVAGTPIIDTHTFPTAGCTRNAGQIYSDGSPYHTCLDDAQIQREVNRQVTNRALPRGLGNIYVMMLPKHVESCFAPGNPRGQECTLNHSASSAYCGYHSAIPVPNQPATIYANLPFPVYQSPIPFETCGNEGGGFSTGEQAPNGDLDADAEVSPLSHEIAEAITDPTFKGWIDKNGNENGDECAYKFGATHGPGGARYNQTLPSAANPGQFDSYLLQEEFSNANFHANHNTGGCVQSYTPVGTPVLTSLSSSSGSAGDVITIRGSNLAGVTGVTFGVAGPATVPPTVIDRNKLTVTVPAAPTNNTTPTVNVAVQNVNGHSKIVAADEFTYTTATSHKK